MVQWNYYQGNKKYEETAGVQCRTNAYFAIDWARCDLDYIFDQDDFSIKHLGITHALAVDELLLFFVLVGTKDIVSNYNTAILLITRTYSATIHIYLLLGKLKNWHRCNVYVWCPSALLLSGWKIQFFFLIHTASPVVVIKP